MKQPVLPAPALDEWRQRAVSGGKRIPVLLLLLKQFYFGEIHLTLNEPLKVHNSVAFCTFTMLCNHHLHRVPKYFQHPKGDPYPLPTMRRPEAPGVLLTCSVPPVGLRWAGFWI